ncbi:MAG: hypothetical protein GEV09_12655 [Pseudonocardiaceae bacterium]|nr:hypothetical protein [Pseudonocardiaceae bacterium]
MTDPPKYAVSYRPQRGTTVPRLYHSLEEARVRYDLLAEYGCHPVLHIADWAPIPVRRPTPQHTEEGAASA